MNRRTRTLLAISIGSGIAAFAMWMFGFWDVAPLVILGSLAPFVWTGSTFALFLSLGRNNSRMARASRGASAIVLILWLWLLAASVTLSKDGLQPGFKVVGLLIAMPVLGLATAYLGFCKRRSITQSDVGRRSS